MSAPKFAAIADGSRGRRTGLLPLVTLLCILAGLAVWIAVTPTWARRIWLVGLIATGAPVVWRTVRGVFARRFAADLVAMLAIVAAVLLGELLAGLIVVLMQTGGEALERYAEGGVGCGARAGTARTRPGAPLAR